MHKDIWTDRQQMLGDVPFEFYHYIDTEPPQVSFHQHPFYELFLFIDGKADYIIEGKTYHLKPGDLLLTNSLDIHRPEIFPGKPYDRVVLWISEDFFSLPQFRGSDLSACFQDAAGKNYRLIRPAKSSLLQIQKLCHRISNTQQSTRLGSFPLVWAYVTELLVEVCRCYFEGTGFTAEDVTENEKINELLEYINHHITEDLTLDELANHAFMSKYYLSRQFKQYTGMGIYQYIMKKRLTISRDLLRNGFPVTRACMDCGFHDYSNYLKAFKKEFGCNPREFCKIIG